MAPHYSSLFTQNRQRERKYGMTHGFNPAEAWVREILSLPRIKLLDGVNQAEDETKELWWWFHNSDKSREWLSQLLVTLTKGRRLGDRVAGIRTGYFSVFHHDHWLQRTSFLEQNSKIMNYFSNQWVSNFFFFFAAFLYFDLNLGQKKTWANLKWKS